MSRKVSPNNIDNLDQSWGLDEASGLPFSGSAVESFIKYMFGTKVGHIEFVDGALQIYDEENGTLLQSISLSGTHFAVAFTSNLPTSFYVLADETSKLMTISPSTTQSAIGQQPQPYTEANGYNYVVAVNSGNGYTPIDTGDEGKIADGGTASFDLRPHLATGKNYVRITVSGVDSGAVKTMVYTVNLTTLSLTVNHPWQNVWDDGEAYTIRNIRFAGSLVKTLHVSLDGVELPVKTYTENISYTATSTTYEIPASAFPANRNSIHTVRLWMTAPGVTTKTYVYHIMCVREGDLTPLVAINNLAETVVNFTSSRLFSYAVFNADSVEFDFSSVFGGTTLPVVSPSPVSGLLPQTQYDFNYMIEINTEDVTATEGTLLVDATPSYEGTDGVTMTGVAIPIDNTFSYLATPGALFYLNAATRDNGNANRETIVNEGTPDSNFAQSYPATWNYFGWMKDGWTTDEDGNKALLVPAGASLSVPTFTPLSGFASYPNGMTVELMFKNVYPADYDTPVITLASGNNNIGITVYPTKVKVFGSNEHSAETVQTAGFDENEIVHLTVTLVKNYGDQSGRNLCSVYINGISNVCFDFQGTSNFGTGSLLIGQEDTDVYLYKMRVYGFALESQQVFNNFLNCAIEQSMGLVRRQLYDKNNGLFFNGSIGYEQAKAAGYNVMVVEIPPQNGVDVPIPSIENSTSYSDCTMRFEYADNPNHNVTVEGLDLDGQGTTSKKYYRWNLRGKTGKTTKWTYGDGTTATGKKGKIINDGVHPLIDRITAKKNYASSPQGHKMGLTGLYNDLFMEIGLGSHLPDEDYRVAVYQFPFVGFKYNRISRNYEFIGLYTAGPDKGSKVTRGFSDDYPSLLALEGPDHDPRGTRFVMPYVNAAYDSTKDAETLTLDGEGCWDCNYVGGGLETDVAEDEAAVFSLYESEWRPAYECVYNNSPYLVSAAEMIAGLNKTGEWTIADLCDANNRETILAGSTNGHSNELLSFYDDNYELYYFSPAPDKMCFVKLVDVDATLEHNVVATLYAQGYLATQSPTTAEIIAARRARFIATVSHYWDKDQLIYHYAFCIYYGVSDNFAKNSYPFKFLPLSGAASDTDYANRWGWAQDDVDTSFLTDNRGQQTKKYSVDHGDTVNGTEIFQGGDSALWVMVRDYFQSDIQVMMSRIASAAVTLASRLGVSGRNTNDTMLRIVSYYCWDHSAKYFSAMLYEEDRSWAYLRPWVLNPGALYNDTDPLTQALGDQYRAEKSWMKKRIEFLFSRYRVGTYAAGENETQFAPTLAANSPFTFQITPAIDMYPVIWAGVSAFTQAVLTRAGNTVALTVVSSGATNLYVKGLNWISSLGDMRGLVLTSRGGSSDDIPFAISGQRLREVKVGDANANLVDFNATSFAASGPSLKTVDGRNTTTVRGAIVLDNCPRLVSALFEGSGASGLTIPVAARVTAVSFPTNAHDVFLHSLFRLQTSGLTLPNLAGIETLYINNCDGLNPLAIVSDILATNGNHLSYVTLVFKTVTLTSLDVLVKLLDLPGYLDYDGNSVNTVSGLPHIEGTIDITGWSAAVIPVWLDIESDEAYGNNYRRMRISTFGTALNIIYDPAHIRIMGYILTSEGDRLISSDNLYLTTNNN